MIKKKIVIAALARDCNKSLIKNIPLIEKLRGHFTQSKVVVIENDSKDGTKETLKQWAKESQGVALIINDFNTTTIPTDLPNASTSAHRISKMVKYRNFYLDYVRQEQEVIDYLIIIDIDVEWFSVSGIIDSLQNAPSDWGALFANGQRSYKNRFSLYHDSYAYVPNNSKLELNRGALLYNRRRLTLLLQSNKYVSCVSAFGGIGIYKWDLIKNSKYELNTNNTSKEIEVLCEHIGLNQCVLNAGYRNYVCQQMKLNYGQRSIKGVLLSFMLPCWLVGIFYSASKTNCSY